MSRRPADNSAMDIPSDLLAEFVGVTNASETLATQLLRDSGLNLESAITSFFAIQDAGGLPQPSSPPSDTAAENGEAHDAHLARVLAETELPEQPVRAPLPQIVDTLLPSMPHPLAAGRQQPPLDAFTQSDGTPHGDGLAHLFRRPTHLDFSGSFEHAMTAGQRRQKWILINMQRADVFACHIMNRDVWADPDIEALVQEHFVFWQRDEATSDGSRYKQFYRYGEPPHVAIIDPRSGERLRTWGGDGAPIDAKVIRAALADFVRRNSLESEDIIPSDSASTRPPEQRSAAAASDAVSSAEDDGDVEITDDAALAAAIAASMETPGRKAATVSGEGPSEGSDESVPNGATGPDAMDFGDERAASRLLSATDPTLNRNRSLRAEQDNEFEESLAMDRAKELSAKAEADRADREAKEAAHEEEKAAESRELKRRRVPDVPPKNCSEAVSELVIRLPSGGRLQRRFLSSSTIGNVYDYVESEAEQLSGGVFELMQPYPRKSFTDRTVALSELAPKVALVVHLL